MSNSFFQFKQFRIVQEKAAMKVCTDSCILGAYSDTMGAERILDIGTGTGLLALMLAQKSNARIDAIEMEEDAYQEAKNNFEASPWKDQLHLYHQRIQDYYLICTFQYDLIISNPPFFTGQLKSPDLKRNIALHSENLNFYELVYSVVKLLKKEGEFYIILPPAEFSAFKEVAKDQHLYLNRQLTIRDKKTLPLFRLAGVFSFHSATIASEELIIKKDNGQYSEKFKELLKEYYLNL